MSLEQTISSLQERAGLLLERQEAQEARVEGHIDNIAAAYTAHINRLSALLYVSSTGDDAASGLTPDAPLATINKAADITPMGGAAEIRLLSDIHVTEDIAVTGKTLNLYSNTSVKHEITFQHDIVTSGANQFSRPKSFEISRAGFVSARGLTIVLPHSNDVFSSLIYDNASSLFRPSTNQADRSALTSIALVGCDVDRPNGSQIYLTAASLGIVVLGVAGVIEKSAPMAGQWVRGGAANAAPSSVPMLQTNLPTL